MTIQIGEAVKAFTLKDQNDKEFNLTEHKGKKVLLSFHPLAWTPVCAKQMLALEKHSDTFNELNTIAVGISVDPVPTKSAWAKDLGIERTQLPSDFWPHGQLARELGIFRDKEGFSQRANVILDENHRVAWVKTYPLREVPDIEEVLAALKAI
ncbi:MAG: redoxin domain-containing protein [Firmicutes bacterium]|nr:redoxin domain-containing protein [Bacillota bacterium]